MVVLNSDDTSIEINPRTGYKSAFARIIPEKAMRFSGAYYHEEDLDKVCSIGMEGYHYSIQGDLAIFLTEKIKSSDLNSEVEDKLQSLVQDAQGNQYLTSWHEIEKIIGLFSELTFDNELTQLNSLFQQWLEQGVQEISIDWYNKNQGC